MPEAPVSLGRKRALEALERRFAGPSVSLEPQTVPKRQKPSYPSVNVEREGNDAPVAALQQPFDSSSKKSRTPSTPDAESHPAYSSLSQIVDNNLITDHHKNWTKGEVANKVVRDILLSGDKGHQYAKGSRSVKLDNWVLLDNFLSKGSALADARAQALKSHSKRSRKHMSMREHRRYGSFDLPEEFHRFDLFKPMHDMWKDYVTKLFKETGSKQLLQSLLMADLHGAILLVVDCKTTALKGVRGIMVRETIETFGIITQDDRFKVVPKMGSVFILQAGYWKITLYGDKLSMRNVVS